MAIALVLMPAVCCCFGLQDQAMAAASSQMGMEDCHNHPPAEKKSNDHHQSSHDKDADNDADSGMGCDDCSYANVYDSAKSDRFLSAGPAGFEPLAIVRNSELSVVPIARLIASIYPHRGPPPLVRTTLVTLHTLLLN